MRMARRRRAARRTTGLPDEHSSCFCSSLRGLCVKKGERGKGRVRDGRRDGGTKRRSDEDGEENGKQGSEYYEYCVNASVSALNLIWKVFRPGILRYLNKAHCQSGGFLRISCVLVAASLHGAREDAKKASVPPFCSRLTHSAKPTFKKSLALRRNECEIDRYRS